ncbi:MAG: hypothetical protein KDC98_04885 [Planctomycetes bacterium]|nr:hypothetical protein [Planctomycetota bacterium]
MKILRLLLWLLAAIPALAAFVWASLAAQLPEPLALRRALGECSSRWDFQNLLTFDGEPGHVLNRLLHLSLLQLPGMTIAAAAFANAALAVVLAAMLARLVRRSVRTDGLGRPLVLFATALLACNPAFGADWLHGERLGRIMVPLLFVVSLLLLRPGRRFAGRALLVLVFTAAAAACHDRGAFVFLALVPAMLAPGRLAWLIALLLIGNVAAFSTFYPAGSVHLAEQGLYGGLVGSFGAAVDELLRTTGSLWPDLWAGRTIDERVLGAVSWLLPLLLLWRPLPAQAEVVEADAAGAESGAPAATDRLWWSCIAFGLLSVAWHHERHGFSFLVDQALLPQARDELLYGGFLLPLGAIGVLAARIGPAVWPIAGGVVMALTLQSWERGAEALRVARADAERVEATMAMPDGLVGPREKRAMPTRDLGELLQLEQHGWIPRSEVGWPPIIQAGIAAEPQPGVGRIYGGGSGQVRGRVRSSLFGGQVGFVVLAVSNDGELFTGVACAVLDRAVEDFGFIEWTVTPVGAIPEGTRLRAVGIDVRGRHGCRLGPTCVVRDGKIVEAGE